METYINPNKFISKLPIKIDLSQHINKNIFNCINATYYKTRLIDTTYSNFSPDILTQTFLYLFNVVGQGIYIHIKKSKIKDFLIFQNTNLVEKLDLTLIKNIKKFIENNITSFENEVIFYINCSTKPVLFKKGYEPTNYYNNQNRIILEQHKYPFHFPIISFSSGYKMNDISLPLIDIKVNFEENKSLMFIFEKNRLDSGITKIIYNQIIEYKTHPFYKEKKLDFIVVNSYFKGNQLIGETNVVIKDPNNPIFLEQLIIANKKVIVIDPSDFFAWYDEFILIPRWKYSNWIQELDSFIKINHQKLKLYSKKDYLISFLYHLSENFRESLIYISPYSKNTLLQIEYNKFFNILSRNYNLIQCWSYRLNPYFLLLDYLKTNHSFIPSFIKLASLSFGEFNNLVWISNQKTDLDMLLKFLHKNKLKNIYSYNSLENYKSQTERTCYFIEFPFLNKKNIKEWENEHLDNLDLINIFLEKIKMNSIVIIKLTTFKLSRTKQWIQLFQQKFESIKIIKNDWFDIYLPFRYLIGINYKHKSKSTIVDLDNLEKDFFEKESNNLELMVKYVNSEAKVKNFKINSSDEIKEWMNKYIIN